MANAMNQMGGLGGLGGGGNPFGGGGNPFGGGGNPFAGGFGNGMFGGTGAAPTQPSSVPSNTPTNSTSSLTKTGHESLNIKTLPLKTKQATLYSSSSSVSKIFIKLKQLMKEVNPSLLDETNTKILNDLQISLTNRKEKPNYSIPSGTFRLMEQIRNQLQTSKVFPVIDILRLLVLHPTAAEFYGNAGNVFFFYFFFLCSYFYVANDFVDNLINEFVIPDHPPSEAAQWLGARVVSFQFFSFFFHLLYHEDE